MSRPTLQQHVLVWRQARREPWQRPVPLRRHLLQAPADCRRLVQCLIVGEGNDLGRAVGMAVWARGDVRYWPACVVVRYCGVCSHLTDSDLLCKTDLNPRHVSKKHIRMWD
jgi:hypothetical protein